MTVTERFRAYLDRLRSLVYMELGPKVAVANYFHRDIYGFKEHPEDVDPLIWFFQSGLHYDVTLSLHRLVDRRGERNIFHFIDFMERDVGKIQWKRKPDLSFFSDCRAKLSAISVSIDHLKTRRDKFFAHYDKRFFYEPDKMDVDCPFTSQDAIEVVRALQFVVAGASEAFAGAIPIAVEGFYRAGAEKMYAILRENKTGVFGRGGSWPKFSDD